MDNSRAPQEVTIIDNLCPWMSFSMVNMKGSPHCHWRAMCLLKLKMRNKIQPKAINPSMHCLVSPALLTEARHVVLSHIQDGVIKNSKMGKNNIFPFVFMGFWVKHLTVDRHGTLQY